MLYFFQTILTVFGRFGSILKQPSFVTHLNLQYDCLNNQFYAVSLFPRSHRSFLPFFFFFFFALASTNPPAIQAFYEIAVFSEFFGVSRFAIFAKFLCGNAGFRNQQCPPPTTKYRMYTISSVCVRIPNK